jgi:hypothetical protein
MRASCCNDPDGSAHSGPNAGSVEGSGPNSCGAGGGLGGGRLPGLTLLGRSRERKGGGGFIKSAAAAFWCEAHWSVRQSKQGYVQQRKRRARRCCSAPCRGSRLAARRLGAGGRRQ